MYLAFKPKLVREEIDEPLSEERKTLAVKASKLLGYKTLERTIPQSEVNEVFASLGFTPLNTDQVHRYERWYRKRHSGHFGWERVAWKIVPLHNYADPIPEFVLSRAVELKEKLPAAEFYVEFPEREERVLPDPFLVMIYKGSSYFIEVWDEPKFEGRRTV